MLARDLAEPYPTVGLETEGLAAARMLAEGHLPGLVVTDENGRPHSVLPGSQVLRFVLPDYLLEDPSLARVYGEPAADRLCGELSHRRVRDVLPAEPHELPIVDGDATTLEIATAMAHMHSPVVAVVENDRLIGAVTTAELVNRLLPQHV